MVGWLKRAIKGLFYQKRYVVKLYGYPEDKGNTDIKVIWERRTFDKELYDEWSKGANFVVGTSFKIDGKTISSSESYVEYVKLKRWVTVFSRKILKGG